MPFSWGMPKDPCEMLEEYEDIRDDILAQLAAGENIVEYEIRNRRVRKNNKREIANILEVVEEAISKYYDLCNRQAVSSGRVRNYIELKRR